MNSRKKFNLRLRSGKLVLGERTLVMGVLNITPDSFSMAGSFTPKNKRWNMLWKWSAPARI